MDEIKKKLDELFKKTCVEETQENTHESNTLKSIFRLRAGVDEYYLKLIEIFKSTSISKMNISSVKKIGYDIIDIIVRVNTKVPDEFFSHIDIVQEMESIYKVYSGINFSLFSIEEDHFEMRMKTNIYNCDIEYILGNEKKKETFMIKSVENKLAELLRETYEKGKKNEIFAFNNLLFVLKNKAIYDIDDFVKRCEKVYAPKLIEIFESALISELNFAYIDKFYSDKFKLAIIVNANIPKEMLEEYSELKVKRTRNITMYCNDIVLTVNMLIPTSFTVELITTYDNVKELLGEDIVKEIYEEVYNSRGVEMLDNWDMMKNCFINR